MNTRLKRAGTVLLAGMLSLAGCQGEKGADGTNGTSCTVTSNGNGTSTITCTDGTTATVSNGTNGGNGTNGTSCTVTDNGNGTKTISCTDGTKVTVYDGASGTDIEVADLHGEAALKTVGEFAACVPGGTTSCGKYFVDVAITGASVNGSGITTVNFTANKNGSPDTTITSVSANIVKLVTVDGYTNWVPYLFSKATVGTTGTFTNPAGTFSYQPGSESSGTGATNGTLTNNGGGSYTYTFKKALPTTYDGTTIAYEPNLTHRVSIMIGGHAGPTGNAVSDFVPAGGAVTEKRNIAQTDSCKSCHGWEFHGHGGNRMLVENCVTCHLAASPVGGATSALDPESGEQMDMKVMIHKIHAGGELASIPGADGIVFDDPATVADESADNGFYGIWGYRNTLHEWSKAGFPAIIENCAKCHQGTGEQVDNWKSKPSRAACGSCHDDVSFVSPAPAGKVLHSGGAYASDLACSGCHGESSSYPVAEAHDWTTKIERNIPEFDVALSMSPPANGTHYVAGEAPAISIALTDRATGQLIDHTTVDKDSAAEGCTAAGPCTRDGLFASSSLYVHGPRAARMPVLTNAARVKYISTAAEPWDLTTATSISLKVDGGHDITVYDSTGGDKKLAANITVNLTAALKKAGVTADEIVGWLNSDANFTARAIAYNEGGKVGIRSRNLGRVFSIQMVSSTVATALFGSDTSVHLPGGSNTLAEDTVTPANNDPRVSWATDKITYQLDPVDDLAPGTYVVTVEISDGGRVAADNYRTPSVAKLPFQVKTATQEKAPAGNCASCHEGPDGRGYVLDYARHHKIFDDTAIDQCGACHDYQPGGVTGTTWPSGKPISKRVHAVHNGSALAHPNETVDHADGIPGRNWYIVYPQSVQNCESCHPAGTTSGSWATKPGRIACWGCHDSDAAVAHMLLQTYDPTPADRWNGDEQESCKACH